MFNKMVSDYLDGQENVYNINSTKEAVRVAPMLGTDRQVNRDIILNETGYDLYECEQLDVCGSMEKEWLDTADGCARGLL